MDRAFAGVEIRQGQFGVDDVDVVSRVNFVVNVDDVVVFEAANHVANRFGFADVGQELVTQTFTFGRALDQAGDVDEFHGGRQDTLWLDDLGQLVQTRIGHRHHTGVRFNGAEREVGCFDTRFGQRVEQGGFAYVRQADDTAFESHVVITLNILTISRLGLTHCIKDEIMAPLYT
ncbi:hypothetical protein D3C75_161210 [compost metagenome]